MTRGPVEALFGRTSEEPPELREHFGALPGSAGFLDGTDVEFNSLAEDAQVESVHGANLEYNQLPLCSEQWRPQNP